MPNDKEQLEDAGRQVELEAERDRTEGRLAALGAERAALEDTLRANEAAHHQMVGRLRYIQEQLGEARPMTDLQTSE